MQQLKASYNVLSSFHPSDNLTESTNSKGHYKNEFDSGNFSQNYNQTKTENNQNKSTEHKQLENQIINKEKLYSLKSVATNEILPQKLSLKSIYVGKARVYPLILPGKFKRDADIINMTLKLNFGIFLLTMFGMGKKHKFVKSKELHNKIMLVGAVLFGIFRKFF